MPPCRGLFRSHVYFIGGLYAARTAAAFPGQIAAFAAFHAPVAAVVPARDRIPERTAIRRCVAPPTLSICHASWLQDWTVELKC